MHEFLKELPNIFIRVWRSLSAVGCLFFREGRQALLDRARARTDLEVLAVQQKRMEIEFQRASKAIDLVQQVEKIKDPQIRERARTAISSVGPEQLEAHGR